MKIGKEILRVKRGNSKGKELEYNDSTKNNNKDNNLNNINSNRSILLERSTFPNSNLNLSRYRVIPNRLVTNLAHKII